MSSLLALSVAMEKYMLVVTDRVAQQTFTRRPHVADVPRLFAGAGPEFLLAAACCRWRPADNADVFDTIPLSAIRWDFFLKLLERHHIAGLAHRALRLQTAVPEDVRTRLAAEAQRNLLSNLSSLGLQRELARMFAESRIDFVVLKGTPLCVQAFGDLRARRSRDIDILIRAAGTAAAERLLVAHGWKITGLGSTVGTAHAEQWMAARKHYEYLHDATGMRLELHWRPFDNSALLSHTLLDRCEWIEVTQGLRLPTLPRTEMLLNLCVHGAGHAWFRLKWIADVAALLEQECCDATALLTVAATQGLDRPVQQALVLCRELFQMEIAGLPARTTPAVMLLSRIARTAILTEDVSMPTAEAAFVPRFLTLSNLLLHTGLRYWSNELRLRLASPADEAAFPLPRVLRFAYPVLRLPFWIKRRCFPQRKLAVPEQS